MTIFRISPDQKSRGLQLIATCFQKTLVDVLALLEIGLVCSRVARGAKTNGTHRRSVTPVTTSAILYATIVTTTKRSLVVALRTLRYIITELGRIETHVHGATALDLIGRTPKRQRRAILLFVRVVATIVLYL